jgi:exonuclease III
MADKNSDRDAGLSTQVHTFNVRGLRDKTKRNRLFTYFKKNMKGIIFLQETHSVPGDHAVWSKEWSGSIYLNSGTSQSRGVAVLIPDKMEHSIQKILQDEHGKYILLEGVFNSYELALCNIYAPTADKQREQLDFLDSIIPLINEYADKLILAGDFNTYMGDLDKHGEIKKLSEYSCRIKTILEELNMCDIYRVLNPEIRRYSWRKMSYLGIQQSRLDYIFIPNSLIYNVLEIEIGHSLYSDHSPIHLKLADRQSVTKGRGFWKLNVSLLKDLEYITQVNKIITEEQEKLKACDKGLAWDTLKMMIRGFSISYASHLAKSKRQAEADLRKQLIEAENEIAINPSENTKQVYTTLIKDLEAINNERTRGQQIRARATHIEMNEKNSAYFFSKEKSNYNTKNISTLHKEDGTVVTDPNEIKACQKKFYEQLYTDVSKNDNDAKDAGRYFLEQNDLPTLSEESKLELDTQMDISDVAKAIAALPNGKAPGSDGFPVEFYKAFWPKIKNQVYDSIQNAIVTGEMSIDQKRGVLTLIPKKDKDIRLLKNWRPLTLLNTDYKIFAKVMATKLQEVLPDLISDDQNGCMKGRSTFGNIRSTIDVISHVNEQKLPGILTYIDFHKAFDTVCWQFMQQVLTKMNFGDYFRNCIEVMYNNIESCVMNNGNASTFFKPTRGIRQGCPISANIFILVVEILAHAIRKNPDIQGIKIDGIEFKISQYADDTCLYLQDEGSLENALLIFQKFSKCSGLNINMEKSEAIWIGASSNYRHKPFKLKWTQGATCLGVYISNNLEEMTRTNIDTKIKKIEDLLKLWNLRKLTILGKVRIVNTLIVPQMLYLGNVIHIPKQYVTKYDQIITAFIWDNKPPKVKYKAMTNSIENGGLCLQDIASKLKSLKLKWITKMLDTTYSSPWKSYLNTKFKHNINEVPLHNLKENSYPTIYDKFYTEIFNMWAGIHYDSPSNNEDMCRQEIWNNDNIRKENKHFLYKDWIDHKVMYIQDLLKHDGSFLKKVELENKYNFSCKQLEYQSLIHAIPKHWKQELKKFKSVNLNYHVVKQCKIELDNIRVHLEEASTKRLYWHLVSKISERPTSEKKWNEKIEFTITDEMWQTIYTNHLSIVDTTLGNFQFKITHRIIACNYNLKLWKIRENSLCENCAELDTIEHMLVNCEEVNTFWKRVFNWWASNMKIWFEVGTYEIVFGIPNDFGEQIINQLNFFILVAKYYIYKCKKTASSMHVYEFLLEIKNRIIMKREIMCEYDHTRFNKCWGELASCILE